MCLWTTGPDMRPNIQIRTVGSLPVGEIYITAVPTGRAPLDEQIKNIFSGIREAIKSNHAHILQERLFGTHEALRAAVRIRSDVYADIDDGVPPAMLKAGQGRTGPLAGVQVHAIAAPQPPKLIRLGRHLCGRVVRLPGRGYLTLSGISAGKSSDRATQARKMLEKAESLLKKYSADFLSVPRTWMWLGNILTWYDDFNHVRNEFFSQRGLIGKGTRQSMPASTGIGLYLDDDSECAMDLTAVLEPRDATTYLQAIGKQQCALEYGSAFSRASLAVTPAAETVYVSGTASIDASGATTHIDDAVGQVKDTIVNVRAVLSDMQTKDDDVVQAIAYCKTTDVEKIFYEQISDKVCWPCITVICDICRPDLLFEIEATAGRKAL